MGTKIQPFPSLRTWPAGQPARIVDCHSPSQELQNQLCELGLTPGTHIVVERCSNDGASPIVLWLGGSKWVVGAKAADWIHLEADLPCKP